MQLNTIIFVAVLACCFISWRLKNQPENEAPRVVIKKPAVEEAFSWNSPVPYEITVEDKEDGKSEFNEIAANEVILKISFLPDSANLKTYLAAEAKTPEPAGLSLMKTSTCFNCHAVKNKLIGPSFEAISKKYPNNASSVAMLTNKVIKGSSSVWGTEKMPPHPDLKIEQADEMISWIMKNCSDSNVNYLPGLAGYFVRKPNL